MKEILRKIQKVKMELEPLSKSIINDYFNSSYFDINLLIKNVEGKLIEHDLVLTQPIIDGSVVTQIYDLDSDQKIESSIKLSGNDNPQKTGSEITYFRRYSLQSLLGLAAEDDDGNKASGNTSEQKQKDDNKPWLNIGDPAWVKGIEIKKPIKEMRDHYKISKANAAEYEKQISK